MVAPSLIHLLHSFNTVFLPVCLSFRILLTFHYHLSALHFTTTYASHYTPYIKITSSRTLRHITVTLSVLARRGKVPIVTHLQHRLLCATLFYHYHSQTEQDHVSWQNSETYWTSAKPVRAMRAARRYFMVVVDQCCRGRAGGSLEIYTPGSVSHRIEYLLMKRLHSLCVTECSLPEVRSASRELYNDKRKNTLLNTSVKVPLIILLWSKTITIKYISTLVIYPQCCELRMISGTVTELNCWICGLTPVT